MTYNLKNCPLMAGIYKINFPNGKSYIGLSNNILRRIKEHNHDKRQPVLFNAIKKYGRINEFEVLEVISNISDRQKLKEQEEYWISIYNTNNKDLGYNLTPGGDSYMTLYNPNGLFSESDLINLKEDLLDSTLSFKQIAVLYNCCEATIQRINVGLNYFNENWEYPVRKQKKSQSGENNHNALFSQNMIFEIYKDLSDNSLSLKKIGEKYGCAETTISAINTGKSYKQNGYDYPIRKQRSRKTLKNYSDEDIETIISLLQEGKMTMEEIGKIFNCSRDYIGDINQGKKYFHKDLTYPLRKRSHK